MRINAAEIEIAAPQEKVWAIVADTPGYPDVDPTCIRVEGPKAAEGTRLKVYSTFSPKRAFPVRVTAYAPPRIMEWTGGMPLGLFKGVRSFAVEDLGNGRSRLALREVFSGPMLPLIGRSLPDMTEAFEGFCRGVKARAEA